MSFREISEDLPMKLQGNFPRNFSRNFPRTGELIRAPGSSEELQGILEILKGLQGTPRNPSRNSEELSDELCRISRGNLVYILRNSEEHLEELRGTSQGL